MKKLYQLAFEYVDKNFNAETESVKQNIAFHAFCDGFNEAMRILMKVGNIIEKDTRINDFNYVDIER